MFDPLPSSEPDVPPPPCPRCRGSCRWRLVKNMIAGRVAPASDRSSPRWTVRRVARLNSYCPRCGWIEFEGPEFVSLGRAYYTLITSRGPDPADARVLDGPAWDIAQFKALMRQAYGLPDIPWYPPPPREQHGAAWARLLEGLTGEGYAASPIAPGIFPLTTAIAYLEAAILRRGETPHWLPIGVGPALAVASEPDPAPKPPAKGGEATPCDAGTDAAMPFADRVERMARAIGTRTNGAAMVRYLGTRPDYTATVDDIAMEMDGARPATVKGYRGTVGKRIRRTREKMEEHGPEHGGLTLRREGEKVTLVIRGL